MKASFFGHIDGSSEQSLNTYRLPRVRFEDCFVCGGASAKGIIHEAEGKNAKYQEATRIYPNAAAKMHAANQPQNVKKVFKPKLARLDKLVCSMMPSTLISYGLTERPQKRSWQSQSKGIEAENDQS